VARPHVATGVMKAALHAQCLADALTDTASSIDVALARYDRERSAFGRWLVERGRHIGRYFEARDADQRQRIETLMTEYGAAGLVADEPITAARPSL
jgi:2-polyprenyl-6-methoxyphenol hydroxylase-like FAD-dependent oxidoreductase